MIEKVECVMLNCDNCKEHYESGNGFAIFADEAAMIETASDDEWEMHHESGKHFCDKCHHYDENDEFVLNTNRTKE